MYDAEHGPGWQAANRAIWIVGTAVVAAHGVALLVYGPSARAAAEEGAREQMTAEHAVICDKLGQADGSPGREACLNLLLHLQHRHEQWFVARNGELF